LPDRKEAFIIGRKQCLNCLCQPTGQAQITQEQLSIGTDLMENASLARRVCKTYMQELQRRLTLGGTIEPGPLTFKSEQMLVCHTYC